MPVAPRPPRTLADDRGAILRIAGNVASGMSSDLTQLVPEQAAIRADDVARVAVAVAVAIVGAVDRRIAAEPVAVAAIPPPPARTGYTDKDNVFHPSPDSSGYWKHREQCDRCFRESVRNLPEP
jgi:hypothetical protein